MREEEPKATRLGRVLSDIQIALDSFGQIMNINLEINMKLLI